MRRRGDTYRQQLEARMEEARRGAETVSSSPATTPPVVEPVEGFSDPSIRAELLRDQLRDAEARVARERAAREQAERRAAALEADRAEAASTPGFSHSVFSKPRRRASWK